MVYKRRRTCLTIRRPRCWIFTTFDLGSWLYFTDDASMRRQASMNDGWEAFYWNGRLIRTPLTREAYYLCIPQATSCSQQNLWCLVRRRITNECRVCRQSNYTDIEFKLKESHTSNPVDDRVPSLKQMRYTVVQVWVRPHRIVASLRRWGRHMSLNRKMSLSGERGTVTTWPLSGQAKSELVFFKYGWNSRPVWHNPHPRFRLSGTSPCLYKLSCW